MRFEFSDYSLDIGRRELRRGPDLLQVEPQVFDLLVYLIENRDRVVTKDDLLGSVWGGRIVSESTLTSRITAVRKAVGDSGERQNLIRTVPRKGFRFIGAVRDPTGMNEGSLEAPPPLARRQAVPSNPLSLPEKPSIAVLPFTNLGEDRETDYFADGIVEDIITALAHVPRLFVVSRNSTFTYKGRPIDIRTVGRELGVRYVLEGAVRRSGDRVRVTGQLIDACDGAHLWAERFDGRLEDIFDLQDEITSRVVGAIAPRLEAAEIERSRRSRPESLDAYDLYLRALAPVREMTREASDEALTLVDLALKIDPNYAAAAGLGAWASTLRVAQNWPVDRQAEERRGMELGRKAVLKGGNDSEALAAGGYALAALGEALHEGLNAIERAIGLNPNSAMALSHAGWVYNYLGKPRQAIEALERSIRLSPRDPALFRAQTALTYAHVLLGEFDTAVIWGRRAVEGNANYTVAYRALASALANAGRVVEARAVVTRLAALTPDLSLRTLAEATVFKRSGGLEVILGGLRKAGIDASFR